MLEIQDRGSPHKHMVLWTNKSADELLADESVVCARMPPINSPLHKLVTDHQIHKCNAPYCMEGDAQDACRFGYPKQVWDVAFLIEMMIARNLDVERGWSNGALVQVLSMSQDIIELKHADNESIRTMCQVHFTAEGNFPWHLHTHRLYTRCRV